MSAATPFIKILREYRHKKRLAAVRKWLTERAEGRTKALDPSFCLSDTQRSEVLGFYDGYPTAPLPFVAFYTAATGKFFSNYIPDDLYIQYIDKYFNNWALAEKMDNKTLYRFWFSDMPQPATVIYRRNGFWFDSSNRLIPESEAERILREKKNYFIKQAVDSYGGKGVCHIADGTADRQKSDRAIADIRTDLIIQEAVSQSGVLAGINPSSVNTLRIVTLLRKDGSVVNPSSILRMGVGGAKVDNASSGGITVGIMENGQLRGKAYKADGHCFSEHPTTGVRFSDITVPSYTEAVEMVKRKALDLPDFRLISWDVAIDSDNRPVLIEANLKDGELDFHQLNNGPMFGKWQREVLEEVFKR